MKQCLRGCGRLISIFILLILIGMFFACYENDNMCYVCLGSGYCYNCYFEKPVDIDNCIVCKGSGICFNCNGSGRVPLHYDY